MALTHAANYVSLRASDGSFDQSCAGIESKLSDAVESINAATAPVQELLATMTDTEFERLTRDPAISPFSRWLSDRRKPPEEREQSLEAAAKFDELTELWTRLTLDTRFVDGPFHVVLEAATELPRADHEEIIAQVAARLAPHADKVATCLEGILADRVGKDSSDQLWIRRWQANQVLPVVGQAVLVELHSNYEVAHRWRAQLSTNPPACPPISFLAAVDAVRECVGRIDPALGDVVISMLDAATVHAAPTEQKPPGAFCMSVAPHLPPYICINYRGRPQDVIRLAHEFGHALHYALAAQKRPTILLEAPVLTSELIAFYIQTQVVEDVLHVDQEPWSDNATRAALRRAVQQDAINTTFRQAAVVQWERSLYEHISSGQGLSAQKICDYWMDAASATGTGMGAHEPYRYDWTRIPHVMHEAFYNATYPVSSLLAHAASGHQPGSTDLMNLMSAGDAHSVDEQLAMVNLTADSWGRGLSTVRALLTQWRDDSQEQ